MRAPRSVASLRLVALLAVSGALCAGCAKRFRITDLETGDVYYSSEFRPKQVTDTGRAVFVDAETGALIRLEEFEYKRIGKRAFRRAVEVGGR
ncbi:MAG: hypothetical protein ACF8QF_05475 [Phycisphaerales bacterium]